MKLKAVFKALIAFILLIGFSRIAASGASVTLAWDPSPDESAGMVNSYTIWYGISGGSVTNSVSVGLTNRATIGGLASGQTYFFYATAYDSGNVQGDPTAKLNYTTPVSSPNNTPPVLAAIPNRTVDEGGTLQFTMSASDSDSPAQTLQFSLGTNAPAGASVNAASGVFTWTPSSAQVGATYQITAQVTDNGSPSMNDTYTFSVTVRAGVYLTVNASPDGTVQMNPQGTTTPSGYRYAPGTSVQLTAQPNSGRAFDRWTVNGQTQTANPLQISMTANTTVTPSFVTPPPPNTAPTLAFIANRTVDEGNTVQFTMSASDADVPAQTLRFSLGANAPAGASVGATSGVFNWQPSAGQAGTTNQITAIVTDNGSPAMSASRTFTVTVRAGVYLTVNQSPDGTVQLNPAGTSTPSGYRYVPGTSVQLTAQPNSGKAFDRWTVNGQTQTANPLTLTMSANTTVTPNFITPNTAPTLAAISNTTVDEGSSVQFTMSASDADLPAQTLRFSLETNAPAGAAVNATNGVFSWQPSSSQAGTTNQITARVTDNGSPALSASQTFTVIVRAGVYLTVNPSSDGTVQLSPAGTSTPSGYRYAPGANVQLTAQPNSGKTFDHWTVNGQAQTANPLQIAMTTNTTVTPFFATPPPPNTAPTLAFIANRTVDEGNAVQFTMSASDSDVPAQALRFSLGANAPAGASVGATSGVFNWQPSAGQVGTTNQITAIVTDDGSPAMSASRTFTVTVRAGVYLTVNQSTNGTVQLNPAGTSTPSGYRYVPGSSVQLTAQPNSGKAFDRWTVNGQSQTANPLTLTMSANTTVAPNFITPNTAPTLASISNRVVDEGSSVQFTMSASDSDVPAQTLRFSLSNAPAGASVNATNGVFFWQPSASQVGTTNQITATVTDDGSPAMSRSRTFTVTVRAGVYLTVNQSTNGTVQLNPAGTSTPSGYRYVPGTSVQLTAQPNSGKAFDRWTVNGQTQTANPLTLTMSANTTVAPNFITPNTTPTLAAISNRVVDEGSSVQFTMSATDSDLPAQTLRFSLSNAPAGAAVNPTNGVFSWQPTSAQAGSTNQITATVTDDGSPVLSASRTFTVVVRAGVYLTLNQSSDGTVQMSPAGTSTPSGYRYVPGTSVQLTAQPNSGKRFARWTVDGQAQTANPLALTLAANTTVAPVFESANTAPTLAAISDRVVDEGNSLQFTLTATDSDTPVQTLRFSVTNAPAGASVDPTNGVFAWQPSSSQAGTTNQITAMVTDDGTPAMSASQTFSVVVRAGVYLTVNQSSDGTVQIDPNGTATPSGLRYTSGSSVQLTAQPNTGKSFDHWTVNGAAQTANPLSLTLNANTTVTPVFTTPVPSNTPPVLAALVDQIIDEGDALQFTASGSDSDVPAQTLRFSLATNAPAGASVNPTNGVFFWRPTAAQSGTTNQITVILTDDGSPAMSASRTFSVAVRNAVYLALNPSANGTVQMNPATTNTASGYRFSQGASVQLMAQPNSGATFNSWTVNGQSQSTNPLTLTMTADLSVTPNFTLTNTPAATNTAPSIATIADRVANQDESIQFAIEATDADVPAQTLRYTLLTNAPAGADLNATNGLFSWVPTAADAGKTNQFTVAVTDDGSPSMTSTQSFAVIVRKVVYLTVNQPAGGTVSMDPATTNTPSGYRYAVGTQVRLTALPGSDRQFGYWQVNGLLMPGNPLNLTLSANTTVTPVFVPKFQLRLVNNNGAISLAWPSSAGQRYQINETDDSGGTNWSTSAEVTAEGEETVVPINPSGPSMRFFTVKGLQD